MGSNLSLVNDTDDRCNIKVFTVGRSFVVQHANLLPGQSAKFEMHKVWYDVQYDFDSGVRHEQPGLYMGSDVDVKLSQIKTLPKMEIDPVQVDEDLAASVRSSSSRSSIDASEEAEPTSHHRPTQDGGTALPKVVLDTNLHCTPMEVFKLCYDDDVFMKQFRDKESGIKDVDCSEWKPVPEGQEGVKCRDISYIMPLNMSVGPSKTACKIVETVEHCDEESYIALGASTNTPDVPYGASFTILTRTCFTWNNRGGTHMQVSCKVQWDKSTMFKGLIESSSTEGQTKHNKALAKELKEWIAAHPDDFTGPSHPPPAQDKADTAPAVETSATSAPSSSDASKNIAPEGAAKQEEPKLPFDAIADKLPAQVAQLPTQLNQLSPLNILLIFTNLVTLLLWLRAASQSCPAGTSVDRGL